MVSTALIEHTRERVRAMYRSTPFCDRKARFCVGFGNIQYRLTLRPMFGIVSYRSLPMCWTCRQFTGQTPPESESALSASLTRRRQPEGITSASIFPKLCSRKCSKSPAQRQSICCMYLSNESEPTVICAQCKLKNHERGSV